MRVAIIGRPNVGKSTLFNRLVGRRVAIVNDRPGVTRDYREGQGRIHGCECTIIDTAGYESGSGLTGDMTRMTETAISAADICLFLFDGRAGVVVADEEIAHQLRRWGGAVILVANKVEGGKGEAEALDGCRLGFGDPLRVSAEHGIGMDVVHDALRSAATGDRRSAEIAPSPIRIVVAGRPNAGKSSLVNRILGFDRHLTGAMPGITRDALATVTRWQGIDVRICDTAGLRRKPKIVDSVEQLSVGDAIGALRNAEVAIILFDALRSIESQDVRIASLAEREGRAIVVALNKWDQVTHPAQRLADLRQRFHTALPILDDAPLIAVSAHTGKGLDDLANAVSLAHTAWNRRVGTGEVNRWLERAISDHPPPAPRGRRIRLRYATQVKARPPTFVIMCSHPDRLPDSYARYLANRLRDEFGLAGTPVRIHLRSRADRNPFAPHPSS